MSHAKGGFAARHPEAVVLHGDDIVAGDFKGGGEAFNVPQLAKVLFDFKGG